MSGENFKLKFEPYRKIFSRFSAPIHPNSYNIPINKLSQLKQKGGGKKLEIEYKSKIYGYEMGDLDDNLYILTSDANVDCVSVVISKDLHLAEIHTLTNDRSCLVTTNESVGSALLKITIKMLKKYKDEFNIKIITIQDNSIKKCKNKTMSTEFVATNNSIGINRCDSEFTLKHSPLIKDVSHIILSKMLTLLNGDTWYGKYGFVPIDLYNNVSIDKILYKKYKDNVNIMNNITIKDIMSQGNYERDNVSVQVPTRIEGECYAYSPLLHDPAHNLIYYIKKTNNITLINTTEKILLSHPDLLLKTYLTNMMKSYEDMCLYFFTFYQYLFDDITYKNMKLTDFYKKTFGLIL